MRKIRLEISYDGTHFCGWQKQRAQRSVQGEIEEGLATIHKRPLSIIGAGRTDAGVHALGQVAVFSSNCDSLSPSRFREALNALLPPDIRITRSSLVKEEFHPRFDAKARVYRYHLLGDTGLLAHWRPYCFSTRADLSLERLNRAAAVLVGVHDFTTFAAKTAGQRGSTVREIYSAVFYREDPFVVFRIVGNAFLWKMIRSLVGTILGLPAGQEGERMRFLLEAKRRDLAGATAPPRGLFLDRVLYA